MSHVPPKLSDYLSKYPEPKEALGRWINELITESPTWLAEYRYRAASEILDNLPILHQQSFDDLVAQAEEVKLEMPTETETTDRLTAIEAELAKMRDLFRMSANDLYTHERMKEMVRLSFGCGCETADALSLGYGWKPQPQPAQTRTYPAVEWRQTKYAILEAIVGGVMIGAAGYDGKFRLGEWAWEKSGGNHISHAKVALESKFRRWWDELHNLNSTNQPT